MLRMPFARAFNPITKTNWEGVAVIPHIKVVADDALEAARSSALEAVGHLRLFRNPKLRDCPVGFLVA